MGAGTRAIIEGLKGAGKSAAKKGLSDQEKLLKIRKARRKTDSQSTYPSPVSKTESKIADKLRGSGTSPGTKTTVSKGMSLEEAPLTKTEKSKIARLAEKAAKTDDIRDNDIFQDFVEKLVEKYGSGIDDIADKVLRNAFTNVSKSSTRKVRGGAVSKKTTYKSQGSRVGSKPRGCGAAQRGYGKAMMGGGRVKGKY